MPFCSNCGKEAGEGFTLCIDCSEKLRVGSTTTEQNQLRKELSGARTAGLVAGIIGSLLIVAAGLGNTIESAFVGLGIFCIVITCFLTFGR